MSRQKLDAIGLQVDSFADVGGGVPRRSVNRMAEKRRALRSAIFHLDCVEFGNEARERKVRLDGLVGHAEFEQRFELNLRLMFEVAT